MAKQNDALRRLAESVLADIIAERDKLAAHAEEYESAAADIRGDMSRLEQYINDIHLLLDQ